MTDMITKMRAKRFWIPVDAMEVRIKPLANIHFVVYVYNTQDGKPAAQFYRRNMKHPFQRRYYESAERRTQRIKEIVAEELAVQEAKQASKTQAEEVDALQVGDIFCSTWGYEQTNVDFYQIVEKHGKTTYSLREIKAEHVDDSHVVPCPDNFEDENIIRKRWNGHCFKVSDTQRARPVTRTRVGDIEAFAPHYVTPAGMGH